MTCSTRLLKLEVFQTLVLGTSQLDWVTNHITVKSLYTPSKLIEGYITSRWCLYRNLTVLFHFNWFVLGPRLSDESEDELSYTHGMIASNIVDDNHHILGDNGSNAGYSGGLVLRQKGRQLLGLTILRSCECELFRLLIKTTLYDINMFNNRL